MTNLIPPSDTNTVSVTFSVRTPAEPVMPNKEQIESFITEKQKKSTSAHISEPPTDVTEQVKSVNGKNLYERENLYEEVWNNPVTKVAEKYGVSDVMIHKVCKALEVLGKEGGWTANRKNSFARHYRKYDQIGEQNCQIGRNEPGNH